MMYGKKGNENSMVLYGAMQIINEQTVYPLFGHILGAEQKSD